MAVVNHADEILLRPQIGYIIRLRRVIIRARARASHRSAAGELLSMRATDWTLHSHYAIVATAIAIINLCAGITHRPHGKCRTVRNEGLTGSAYFSIRFGRRGDGSKELIMAERLWKRTPETVTINSIRYWANRFRIEFSRYRVSLERPLFTYQTGYPN